MIGATGGLQWRHRCGCSADSRFFSSRFHVITSGQAGLPSTAKGDWIYYNADIKGTKYSPLDQINASNFGKLEIAWRFKTDFARAAS
jgi:glucose dehydrogenase